MNVQLATGKVALKRLVARVSDVPTIVWNAPVQKCARFARTDISWISPVRPARKNAHLVSGARSQIRKWKPGAPANFAHGPATSAIRPRFVRNARTPRTSRHSRHVSTHAHLATTQMALERSMSLASHVRKTALRAIPWRSAPPARMRSI